MLMICAVQVWLQNSGHLSCFTCVESEVFVIVRIFLFTTFTSDCLKKEKKVILLI